MSTGIVYDATNVSRILGFGDPVPDAADGEIVLYYGGWHLMQLRCFPRGKRYMRQQWFDSYGWKAEPGYYRLLLPVPDSNRMTWSEQLRHLAAIDPAWQPAPVCIATTALLVHAGDLLRHEWCRCGEALSGNRHADITARNGLVSVSYFGDDRRDGDVWLAAARKS